jgi:Flp pilus assembly pilin Flp
MRIISKRMKQAGQGMTEYIIIVALIAVAAIAVTQLFGATIRQQMAGISQEVAGTNGSAAITKAGDNASLAKDAADKDRTLSKFGDQAADGKQK